MITQQIDAGHIDSGSLLTVNSSSVTSIIGTAWDSPATVDMSGVSNLELSDDIKEKMFTEFMSKLSRVPTVKHECHSCGGTVEFDADKHIFICPYCGSCYAVGTAMINSTY